MNPILNALNGQQAQNPVMDQARQMYKAYQTAQNPTAYLRNVIAQNPMLGQLAGGDLRQAFYSMCQQRGIDPQTVLDSIQR